jgi:nitrate/nitrite transporter NarK
LSNSSHFALMPFPPEAQNEESGLLGGEAGSKGGLGALTAPGTFSVASHKTSTLRSGDHFVAEVAWGV